MSLPQFGTYVHIHLCKTGQSHDQCVYRIAYFVAMQPFGLSLYDEDQFSVNWRITLIT